MTTQYELYNTGDSSWENIYGVHWGAQTFTVGAASHTIASVKLKLFRYGSPGTVTVGIRAVDGNGHPTGSDLTTGTINGNSLTTDSAGVLYEITVAEYALPPSTKYAIVVRAPSGDGTNYLGWRVNLSGAYADGNDEESANSGSTWTAWSSYDLMFEVWGNAGMPINISDAGSGVEVARVGLTMADSGSGSETSVRVGPLATDSGSGTETALTITAALSLADSGAGAEAIGLNIGLTVTDANGATSENVTLQGQISAVDSGYGVDVVSSISWIMITDAGSGADTPILTAYMTLADSGSGLELGGLTTYLYIWDVNTAAVETVTTPGTLTVVDEGKGAEFAWRIKPSSPMIDTLALPHVLSIRISDPAIMSDKKVQGGSLPRRTMVGKPGRVVEIEGWSDDQSEIDALDALRDGVCRIFYPQSGDSFGVLVTDFQPSRTVDQYNRRTYRLSLAEAT